MRIAVLGSSENWYLADLRRAAGSRHELVAIGYSQLASSVAESVRVHSAAGSLHDFSAVLVRSMPAGSLEHVIFRMDALANLAAAGTRVVNPPRAIEVAVDKYLATTRLAAAGMLVPRTIACQTVEQALGAFEELDGDAVLKPLFGSEGRGIVRITDADTAYRTFRALVQIGAVFYLQEFIPHEGCDLRLLVIGQQVLGMKRCHDSDWRTNISRGAQGKPLEVTAEFAELARLAASAVGATIAGVDLLPGVDGRLYAIEVNAVPGWRGLSAVTGCDVAKKVVDLLESSV
jgi:ribosomal protein S6--L-glutamate ligase